jgi:aubergine-like protein
VNRDFEGAVVMANYGQKRTYKVNRICWEMTPATYFFDQGESGDKKIKMLDYFLKVYDTKITQPKQPLFEIKQKKQNIYLPPELCILVGIPPKIRENKRIMADIRQSLFQKPEDRIRSITQLNKMISDSKEVKDWDLELNLEPDQIEAKVLKRPGIMMFNGPQPLDSEYHEMNSLKSLGDTNILRQIVCQPVNFQKWAIFCLERDIEQGKYLQDKFYALSEQYGLNIFVDFGDIVSLNNRSGIEDFKDAINSYFRDYVGSGPKKGQPVVQFFLVIIPDTARQEHFYTAVKNKINSDNPIISQFVTSKTINRDNDRIYLNIVRQINAKLGGDLWRMNFGKDISPKTMLVGIDVCHKGKQSIIGFVATYDPYLAKYYTQASPQAQKGQEIISSNILQEYFGSALAAYRDFNNGALPDHIFIYRDGVGDSMRKQVIQFELDQLKKILTDEYDPKGEGVELPNVTLIIVNKRVRQRFFEKTQGGHGGQIFNPPQGTYVDTGFVEQSEVVDGKFDFFLVPHSVTQGAVKPTHFYVAQNTSLIPKDAILNFTYALCYNYYNWPDSIKVPAPCMLADKIAIYRSEIGNIPSNVDLHKLPFYL